MEDKRIVDLYWMRAESAISETDKKYGKYCRYIAERILESEEDAREVQNDTYLQVWNTVPPERPNSLRAYLGAICRNLSLNRYEASHAQKRGGEVSLALDELSECIADREEQDDINERLCELLDSFLATLPKRTRRVFLRRYWYASSISEIAKDYGMSENNVTVMLHRTRKALADILQKEGFLNE
jgi:RNA polymerase sigma-70 factor (ECF subfamily)